MAENSRGGLFRPRNILGAALIGGIALGIYLGPLFKGWGFGGGKILGTSGQNSDVQASLGTESKVKPSTDSTQPADSPDDISPTTAPAVVKVLIDDRTYFLRQSGGDVPIELPRLMKLVKQSVGDSDGFRIRIYEKSNARVSAEEALKEALAKSQIPDTAVLWVPNPVK